MDSRHLPVSRREEQMKSFTGSASNYRDMLPGHAKGYVANPNQTMYWLRPIKPDFYGLCTRPAAVGHLVVCRGEGRRRNSALRESGAVQVPQG